MRKFLILILVLVVFLVVSGFAFIQEAPPDLTDFGAVILWLATVGSPFVVGWALSLIIENWSGWATLPRWIKFFAPMVAAIVISVGANLLLKYPVFIETIAPWFTIVMGAVLGWLGTQGGYMISKRANYGARFDG